MTASDDRFVAVGEEGLVITSSDGLSWQKFDVGFTSDLLDVTFANDHFVAVGRDGLILRGNAAADFWNQAISGTASPLFGLTWAGPVFLACGSHGTILTSELGGIWDFQYLGENRFASDVLWTGIR